MMAEEFLSTIIYVFLRCAAILALAIGCHRLYRKPVIEYKKSVRNQLLKTTHSYSSNMNDSESMEYARQVFQAHHEFAWTKRVHWLNQQMPIFALGSCVTLIIAELFSRGAIPEEWANSLLGVPAVQSFYLLTILLIAVCIVFMGVIIWHLGFPPSIELEPVEEGTPE